MGYWTPTISSSVCIARASGKALKGSGPLHKNRENEILKRTIILSFVITINLPVQIILQRVHGIMKTSPRVPLPNRRESRPSASCGASSGEAGAIGWLSWRSGRTVGGGGVEGGEGGRG